MTDELEPGDPLLDAARALRQSTPLRPGLPERVGVRRVRRQRQRRAGMLAGALTAVLAAVVLIRPHPPADLALVVPPPPALGEERTFALDAPAVHTVALVGDFTDWQTDSIPLREGKDGKWEVTVRIPPGRYRYAFVVDNDEWRADPEATPVPGTDDFGRPTSVLTVTSDQ